MGFYIIDHEGGVVSTSLTAREARIKLAASDGLRSRKKLIDVNGATISDDQLEILCQQEAERSA